MAVPKLTQAGLYVLVLRGRQQLPDILHHDDLGASKVGETKELVPERPAGIALPSPVEQRETLAWWAADDDICPWHTSLASFGLLQVRDNVAPQGVLACRIEVRPVRGNRRLLEVVREHRPEGPTVNEAASHPATAGEQVN